ncbi:MAG: cupin domain-containing protein [Pseudomonadales bacterium]|jgi:hypothetical protein|nr:cupin domain-containing protein [Pseudomonadales bacterium]
MGVTITKGDFGDKSDAIAEVESQGLFAREGAMGMGDLEDVHWHKTSLKIYVLEGSFETRDVEADADLMAGPGDIISIPAETLHAARCPIPARYVVGFESAEAAAAFRPEVPADLPR